MSNSTRKNVLAISYGIIISIALTACLVGYMAYGERKERKIKEYNEHYVEYGGEKTGGSTSKIESFNSEFTIYCGDQTGSQVKQIIMKLIENAQNNSNLPVRIPCVSYTSNVDENENSIINEAYGVSEECNIDGYINYLNSIDQILIKKHIYYVYTETGSYGMVRGITINDGLKKSNFEKAYYDEENLFGIKASSNVVNTIHDNEIEIANIKCSVEK